MKRLLAIVMLLGASPLLALNYLKILANADKIVSGANSASSDFASVRKNSMTTITVRGKAVPIPKATLLLKCAAAGGGSKGGACSQHCSGAADCARKAIDQIQMVLNALIDNALKSDSFLMTVLDTIDLQKVKNQLSEPGKQIIEMAKTLDSVKSAIQS